MPLAPNIYRGSQLGWGQILLTLYGIVILGLTEISYDEEHDDEVQYGAGNYPQGIGFGNVKFSGNMKMYRWQVNQILVAVQAAGGNSLADAPVSAATILGNTVPAGGNETYTDVVTFKFKKTGRNLKQGDKMDIVDCPLIVINIKWGAGN